MNQKLIEDNMNLVYFLIHKHFPTYVGDEDIVQCGMLGLCKAAATWDDSQQTLFSTYASKCIRNEIYKEFNNRNKHKGVLSLDYPTEASDGVVGTFGDLVVGNEDIDYVDIEKFYDQLNPKQQQIFTLLRSGLSQSDIATQFGVTRSSISKYVRQLKILWRKCYGD